MPINYCHLQRNKLYTTNEVAINFTPMFFANGVLGLPIEVFRNWEVQKSISGSFEYAGVTAPITLTRKRKNDVVINGVEIERAKALQFSINDPRQFAQLKLDGVHTYLEEQLVDEKIICTVNYMHPANGEPFVAIKVTRVDLLPDTPYSLKVRELLKQQITPPKNAKKDSVHWGQPTGWLPIEEYKQCTAITKALYMWFGTDTGGIQYLYTGIVGDSKNANGGMSKSTLTTRMKTHIGNMAKKGITITTFRYDTLVHYPAGIDPTELLKTAEMRQITALSAVLPCDGAQSQISPLLPNSNLVLLNACTSYHSSKRN